MSREHFAWTYPLIGGAVTLILAGFFQGWERALSDLASALSAAGAAVLIAGVVYCVNIVRAAERVHGENLLKIAVLEKERDRWQTEVEGITNGSLSVNPNRRLLSLLEQGTHTLLHADLSSNQTIWTWEIWRDAVHQWMDEVSLDLPKADKERFLIELDEATLPPAVGVSRQHVRLKTVLAERLRCLRRIINSEPEPDPHVEAVRRTVSEFVECRRSSGMSHAMETAGPKAHAELKVHEFLRRALTADEYAKLTGVQKALRSQGLSPEEYTRKYVAALEALADRLTPEMIDPDFTLGRV